MTECAGAYKQCFSCKEVKLIKDFPKNYFDKPESYCYICKNIKTKKILRKGGKNEVKTN